MDKVNIVSDHSSLMKSIENDLSSLSIEIIDFESFQEEDLHDWVTKTFQGKEIKKLLIPISIPSDGVANSEGLKIALHLRLNYELSIEERCIPILFLSDLSLDILAAKMDFDRDSNPQNLFFTKGVYRVPFDKEVIVEKLKGVKSLSNEDYFRLVKKRLNISQKETEGNHSMANAWGCYKLSLAAGLKEEVLGTKEVSRKLKSLYSKYLISCNDAYISHKYIDLKPVKSASKKILFIDDQSDEGWGVLMKGIFAGAKENFVCVDSGKYKNKETKQFHNFQGFLSECRSHIGLEWDLIIIDLRLHPEKEDIDSEAISPKNLSGYKLIEEFLTENEGYQIIVSTASNKIWNVNTALERGVSGFYIKESPEFRYTIKETKVHYDNLKNEVRKCFDNKHQYTIFQSLKDARENNSNSTSQFISESNTSLDIAWQQIKHGHLDFAFLTLYQILENLANTLYCVNNNQDTLDGVKAIDKLSSHHYEWLMTYVEDSNNGSYFNSNKSHQPSHQKPRTLYKVSCLFKIKYSKDDTFLKELGSWNKKRNDIAHEGAKRFTSPKIIEKILKVINEVRIQ